jgi:hypothetical protein
LKDLHGKFDPSYAHSDDYNHFKKHDEIASRIHHLKKQLGEDTIEELSTGTLDSYASKARAQASDLNNKGSK